MKITDIIVERKIDEAPVGMLKRAGLGIAAKLGSSTAQGALDTAEIANGLRKAYSYYLGQTGQKPNSESLIAFFQQNGLSTDGVEQAIQKAVPSSGVKFMPGRKMPTRSTAPTDQTAKTDDQSAKSRVEPSLGDEPPAAAPTTAAPASTTTSDDDMMNKLRASATKAKLKGGRGIAKQTGSGFSNAVKAGQAKGLNMSQTNDNDSMLEANIPSSVIDKVILAAIQDNIKQGMGQKLAAVADSGGKITGSGAANAAGGDDEGGFGSSFSQAFNKASGGMAGDAAPKGMAGVNQEIGGVEGNLNAKALAQLLPNVDPAQFTTAVRLAMRGGGQKINQQQIIQLAQGFIGLLKADPQTTTKVMTLLKRVSAPAQ